MSVPRPPPSCQELRLLVLVGGGTRHRRAIPLTAKRGTVLAGVPRCSDGRDPQLAWDIKQAYKGVLTLAYAQKIADAVGSANGMLNIIDIGGIPSEENQLIVGKCTHAVILAGDDGEYSHQERWAEWESYCAELGVPVIAKIHSDYNATSDRVDSASAVLTGVIHHLSRGEDVSDRPMIRALADLVVKLTI